MYKILCYLLALMLAGTSETFGQKPPVTPVQLDNPVPETPDNPASDAFASRKTTFTDHPLADRVEPGKKHAYDAWVMGRTVSLPCPNPYQTQLRWQ